MFIAGCGDEGDTTDTTEGTTGMTDIVQPTTPPPETDPPPLPEDPVVVEEPGISFQEDIRPILAERCAFVGCHAAPGAAGLDLTKYDTFKKGGNNGPAFTAGDGKGSLVVKRIDGGGMPPGGPPLDGTKSNSSLTGLMKVPKITKVSHSIPFLPFCVKLKSDALHFMQPFGLVYALLTCEGLIFKFFGGETWKPRTLH